jgi:hypothetical protein
MGFPINPTNGQTTVTNNINYIYNASINAWTRQTLFVSMSTTTSIPTVIYSPLSIQNYAPSVSTSTGALIVGGGLGVGGNINAGGFIVSTSTRVTGLSTFTNTLEVMNNVGSVSGTTTFLFNAGQTYYVTPSAAWNIALTGVPTDPQNYTSIITFIISQGSTAYTATTFSINGTGVTPKWSGGVVWPGNASHTDIVAYGIVNIAGTFSVYAQWSTF